MWRASSVDHAGGGGSGTFGQPRSRDVGRWSVDVTETRARARFLRLPPPRAGREPRSRRGVELARRGKYRSTARSVASRTRTGRFVRDLLGHALGHDEVRHLVDQAPQRGRAVRLLVLVRQRPGLALAHAPIAGSLGRGEVGRISRSFARAAIDEAHHAGRGLRARRAAAAHGDGRGHREPLGDRAARAARASTSECAQL